MTTPTILDKPHGDDCDLSIIIVNWNTRQMTLDCLHSMAEARSMLSCETIVVDNDSADGSPDAIEAAFPEVRVIRNTTNRGFAGGNNQGLAIAKGRVVALINSDVIVLPGCLQTMLRFMDENPNIGLASPRILNRDRSLQLNCLRAPDYWNRACETLGLARLFPNATWFAGRQMSARMHAGTRDVDVLVGSFWVARAEAYRQVGGLDDGYFMYGEDTDWCMRFRRAKWRVVYHVKAEAIHLGGSSSSRQPIRFYIELQKSTLRYWKIYFGRLGWLYCAFMIFVHQMLRIPVNAIFYLLSPSKRQVAAHKIQRSAATILWLTRLKGTQSFAHPN